MNTVKIKGMSCQHCVASVIKTLSDIPEISNIKVDLGKGEVTFDGEADRKIVRAAIESIGFEVV